MGLDINWISWLVFWFLLLFNTSGFRSCRSVSLTLSPNLSSRVSDFQSTCSKLFHFVIFLIQFFLLNPVNPVLSFCFTSKTIPVFWYPSMSCWHQPSITTKIPFSCLFRFVTFSVSATYHHFSLIIIITLCSFSIFFNHRPQRSRLLTHLLF
jgi:hypothetical protein